MPRGLVWLEIEGGTPTNIYEVTYSTSNQRLFFGMFNGMYKTKTPRRAHEIRLSGGNEGIRTLDEAQHPILP